MFRNFHVENITAPPVLLRQCTHWAGWGVPSCAEYPATGFTLSNITWTNFTGWMSETVNTTTISLACSPNSLCSGFKWDDINVVPQNGTATGKCTNVDGYDDFCIPTAE